MDIISYNIGAIANDRIEKFIKDPDSNSGIVTVPKVIGAGENVTVPAGRVAVLPNVQVDGTLNVEGEVFIPSGATFGDLESQIDTKQSKSELAYNVGTSSYIPNTLASGAIIERGSNANGEYTKFADGTLICIRKSYAFTLTGETGQLSSVIPFPATFSSVTVCSSITFLDQTSSSVHYNLYKITVRHDNYNTVPTGWLLSSMSSVNGIAIVALSAIGRWK